MRSAFEPQPHLRTYFDALWERYRDDHDLSRRITEAFEHATAARGGNTLLLQWLEVTVRRAMSGARPSHDRDPPEHSNEQSSVEHWRITKLLFAVGIRDILYHLRTQFPKVDPLPPIPESDAAIDALYRVATMAASIIDHDLQRRQDRLDAHLYAACTGLQLGVVPSTGDLLAAGFPSEHECRAWAERRTPPPTTNRHPGDAATPKEEPTDAPPSET